MSERWAAQDTVIANSNPAFGIEVRGFERIPEAERNMTLRHVGLLWFGTNMNLLCIIVGCSAITLGLNLWWALAACLIGNLPYVFLALGSVGTVRAGLPVTTLSRALFGVRGNFPNALCAWLASVAFEVINTIFGVYAILAALPLLGWRLSDSAGKLFAVFVQLLLGGGVAVLGHATLVFLQRFFALFLGAVLLVVLVYTSRHVDWVHATAPRTSLPTAQALAALMTACGVVAFAPLSYLYNGPDWVRYLPSATPARQIFGRVFWWTFLPSVVITVMGAIWATLGDMSDPVAGLKPFIPPGLFVAFLIAVIGGALANNVPTFYSSGLSLQALGLRVRRWVATALDVCVSTAVVVFILFVRDFTTTLNNFIPLLLVWVGPYAGVWLCGGVLQRWNFPPETIHPSGRAISRPRDSATAWIAFLAGCLVAMLTMRSSLYMGPIAKQLGGLDLNWLLGLPVSAGTYALCALWPMRLRWRSARPVAGADPTVVGRARVEPPS